VRFGSLFSGIGGLDLGLEMAGMECSWMVEVDKFGSQILKHHWPDAEIYGDIYTIDGKELKPVDLICGGFPCQPVSFAGKRAGTTDERWLWGEFARIIRQVKPRWVVAENVTGLLSANSGRAFAEVLRDLAQIGYNAVWNVFPAGGQGGVGAPHRRERIFIIAKKITDTNDKRVKRRKRLALVQDGRDSDRVRSTLADTDSKSKYNRSNSKDNKKTTRIKRQKTRLTNRKSSGKNVANSKRIRQQGSRTSRKWSSSETHGERQTDNAFTVGIEDQWSVEPDVGRVAHGIPNRMDRLKALGNAVVPQVAKQIGEMIMEIENV